MKKSILIIITVAIVIIVGIGLFSFRHVIIGHALKVTISKKTNETISLNIGEIYYDIINSSVSFSNSKFNFKNTYLNDEKTIELSELKFDQIQIVDLSIFRLIFEREVVADKITISKPSLWFMENNNPKPFKEKPREIIKSLKKHHDILKNLTIIVGEIEIVHGKVDLKSLIKSNEHAGSVEFKLLLRKINTSKKHNFNEDKILFAEDHFIKLTNFDYTLPVGDKISFDSMVFDSRLNNLITSNINIDINSDAKGSKTNSITTNINEVIIAGINFQALEHLHLHDIEIDSIKISDGQFFIKDNNVNNNDTNTFEPNYSLFEEFNQLSVNSFILDNINIVNSKQNGDTVINLQNINFSVSDIVLDSASLANKIPNINYNSIDISTGKLQVFEKKSGLELQLGSIAFKEKDSIIFLNKVYITDEGASGLNKIIGDVTEINITGVSAHNYVIDEAMKIGLNLTNPTFDIDLRKTKNKKHANNKTNLEKIEISEINILDGEMHLFEEGKFDMVINNLNFNSGKMKLPDLDNIHEINTDNFLINSSSLKINLPKEDVNIKSGAIYVKNNIFKVLDISTYLKTKQAKASVTVKQLELDGYSIKELVNKQAVSINNLKITKPIVKGELYINSKKSTNLNNQTANGYKVNIDDFKIINGDVDLNMIIKKEELKLKTGVDVSIKNINIANINDTVWYSKILWKVNLTKPVVHYQNYLISCNNILSNKLDEKLILNDVEVSDNLTNDFHSGVNIVELRIKNVIVAGLDYNTIIHKQTPILNAITIEKPYFDIKIDNRSRGISKPKGHLNKTGLPFDINDLEIKNLSFKLETVDSTSASNITLHNIDFKYNLSVNDNLINGLYYFNLNGLLFSDTIKNIYLDVEQFNYGISGKEISVSHINGGSIKKQQGDKNYIHYGLSDLNITGINISQSYPHNLNFKDIRIDDFNLDIKDYDSKSKNNKPKNKKELKLPSLINALNISTVNGNNFNINHSAVSDSSDKKLSLRKIDFLITSIKIDSSTLQNKNFAFVDEVYIKLNDNEFVSKDSLYVTSANSVSYNFIDNRLTIDTLLMKPRYKPAEFFKKAKYQTGKMDITTSKIICNDIRLEQLINHGEFHAGSVDVNGLEMFIFRNKKYEMDPNLYKKMPQEALLSIPHILTIDSLKTHNSYIEYKQLSKKSVVPGIIFLDKVNLSIFNINNNLKVIDNTSIMTAKFNAKLLGESTVDLKMTFPILSPAYNFWVSGYVHKVDFTKLNSMTQNLVGVTLKRGTGELDIPLISGNSEHSTGTIAFKYKKLKIELYDRDKAQNATGLGGNMANLLLNDILIKSNNPGFLGKTRTGDVYFKRNTQKSIVYYTWKSILSGIMSTMGYNNKEQRQEKRASKRRAR